MANDSLLDKFPEDTPDYMVQAWVDCLHWAIGNSGIRTEFEAATGAKWIPGGRSPIERMIDEATGVHKDYILKFTDWFNVNVWGAMADGDVKAGE